MEVGAAAGKQVIPVSAHVIEGRVCQNRNTAGLQDQCNGLCGRHFFPRYKVFRVIAQILCESFLPALYITVFK